MVRENTDKLIEMLLDGELDPERLIIDLLKFMTEEQVTEFLKTNFVWVTK